MEYALAYLGTLAALCFALWVRFGFVSRGELADLAVLEARVTQLEQAAASPSEPPDLAAIRETVSALALHAGLKRKG